MLTAPSILEIYHEPSTDVDPNRLACQIGMNTDDTACSSCWPSNEFCQYGSVRTEVDSECLNI